MPKDNFSQRKKSILSKEDKSSRGKWDSKIVSLCKKINEKEEYCTTSSCSGRVVVMVDKEKKESDLFKFVSHDLISLSQLREALNNIAARSSQMDGSKLATPSFSLKKSLSEKVSKSSEQLSTLQQQTSDFLLTTSNESRRVLRGANLIKFKQKQNQRFSICLNLVKFKQEPCLLHVACKTIEDAKKLLDKSRLVGWKKLGVVSLGNNMIVELSGTEKLEFPIVREGKILVGEEFLKVVVEKSNYNLKRNWKRIEKLGKLI
ncbi:MAG: hypothetical protein KJ721_02695 [Nanoarchaeota archaeon]|nr:hypothetical protein [Nanoarchaeota archaeon]